MNYKRLELGDTVKKGDQFMENGAWREAEVIGRVIQEECLGAYRRPYSDEEWAQRGRVVASKLQEQGP